MKKRLSFAGLLILAVLMLGGCGISAEKAGNSDGKAPSGSSDIVLTAATQTDYPPFCFIDENDKHTGFDYELLQLIDERLDGYTIDIKGATWDSMFLSLDSKKIDLVSDEVAITPEREKNYYFSLPYLEIQSCIAVKKGTTGITTLDDLVGKHVVTTVDSYSEILENYNDSHDEKIIIEYVSEVTALEMLQGVANGKYDAHINDPVMMHQVIGDNNLDLEIVGNPVKSDPAAIVFAKTPDGKSYKDVIDPVIREIIEDGSLAELSKKWTGEDYTPDLKDYE
ncbi:MAG: transporter substrate-binding domain-containing protein [Lachnospiraceae bacterium]|nr:transporter substrate-binding domain-containing protein [Lachnospiraceae bacterium]